jgi:hypothetical protein
MKFVTMILIAAVAMFIPLSAVAQNVEFDNHDGTFTYNTTNNVLDLGVTTGNGVLGLPEAGKLTGIGGLGSFGVPDASVTWSPSPSPGHCTPACLGSLTLITGPATSTGISIGSGGFGSATFGMGGSFSATFTNGVLFTGQFSSATFTQSGSGATSFWTFVGSIMNGTLTIPTSSGTIVFTDINAGTIQLTTVGVGPSVHTSKGVVTYQDSSGSTNFPSPAPEPGTLTLFGTGLIAVGMLTRRKLAAGKAGSSQNL